MNYLFKRMLHLVHHTVSYSIYGLTGAAKWHYLGSSGPWIPSAAETMSLLCTSQTGAAETMPLRCTSLTIYTMNLQYGSQMQHSLK
jgi:hypothetical protein